MRFLLLLGISLLVVMASGSTVTSVDNRFAKPIAVADSTPEESCGLLYVGNVADTTRCSLGAAIQTSHQMAQRALNRFAEMTRQLNAQYGPYIVRAGRVVDYGGSVIVGQNADVIDRTLDDILADNTLTLDEITTLLEAGLWGELQTRMPDVLDVVLEQILSDGVITTNEIAVLEEIGIWDDLLNETWEESLTNISLSVSWQPLNPQKAGQMIRRGWTIQSVQNVLDNPCQTLPTLWRGTGDSATAYYRQDGYYVVRNDVTGEVFQFSDVNDPNWSDDIRGVPVVQPWQTCI